MLLASSGSPGGEGARAAERAIASLRRRHLNAGMSSAPVQIHPEAAALHAAVGVLRGQLAGRLEAWHDLVDVQRPWLLALYQEKLGAWELRRLTAQTEAARARRRLEHFQAALNEGKPPDLERIDATLTAEFMHWHQKIKEAAAAHERAQQWVQGEPLKEEDRAALKEVYRILVKALHPDLHPVQTEEQQHLWQKVQEAHAAHALADLQALAALVQARPALEEPDALEMLDKEKARLTESMAALAAKHAAVLEQPPLTLRGQLEDDAWIASRRTALEAEIAPLETQRDHFEKRLQQLIALTQHAGGFGSN